MPYRHIELTLPDDLGLDLDAMGEKIKIIDRIDRADPKNGRHHVNLLVHSDQTEPALQYLAENCGDAEGFHAAVIELVALRPQPTDEEAKVDEGEADDEQKRALNRISRHELLQDLEPGTAITRMYLLTVVLSSVIAAVGLLKDNAALVIGAMVIAPLLLPNMSMALATTLGDFKMMLRAAYTNLAGVATCLGFAVAVGSLVNVDPTVQQLGLRTTTSYSDVAVALAAGSAGAIAVTSGVSAGLVGVMVAVALLPPMVAFGLLLGAGQFWFAKGAGLLVAVNLTCVNLAAVTTFLLRGIRPGTWYEADRAKKATWSALAAWILALIGTLVLIYISEPNKPGS